MKNFSFTLANLSYKLKIVDSEDINIILPYLSPNYKIKPSKLTPVEDVCVQLFIDVAEMENLPKLTFSSEEPDTKITTNGSFDLKSNSSFVITFTTTDGGKSWLINTPVDPKFDPSSIINECVDLVLQSEEITDFIDKYTIYNIEPNDYAGTTIVPDNDIWSGCVIYVQGGICHIQGVLKTTEEVDPNTSGDRDIFANLPFSPMKNFRTKCLTAYKADVANISEEEIKLFDNAVVTVQSEDNSVYISYLVVDGEKKTIPEGTKFCIDLSFAIDTDNNQNIITVDIPNANDTEY